MDLTINRAHARLGKRNRLMKHPVALALKAEGFVGVRVWNDMVEFREPGQPRFGSRFAFLPKSLQKTIVDHDNGKPFKVGTYRIAGLRRPKK